MGNRKSVVLETNTSDDLVLQVVRVSNVPKENIKASDPFLELKLKPRKAGKKAAAKAAKAGNAAHEKTTLGLPRKLVYFQTCEHPVWNSFANFGAKVVPGSEVVCKIDLWDHDVVTKNDKYGSVVIPCSQLMEFGVEKEFEIVLRKKQKNKCTVTLKRVGGGGGSGGGGSGGGGSGGVKKTKKIFVIRHGESQWNEAQEEKDVVGMLEQVDHPLNEKGCKQASDFNAAWKKKKAEAEANTSNLTEKEKLFFNADMCFASPLTRTTQTALLTMQDHPAMKKKGLTLLRNLREIKQLGGLDTVGKAIGEDIVKRVKEETAKTIGEDASKAAANGVEIHLNDAVQQWWSGVVDRDNSSEMEERFHDWLSTVRHADYDVGVFVGHSLFYRKFCKDFCSEAFEKSNPEMAKKMGSKKLQNAGCLYLELDFSAYGDGNARIVDAEPMFGTGFDEQESSHHPHHDGESFSHRLLHPSEHHQNKDGGNDGGGEKE